MVSTRSYLFHQRESVSICGKTLHLFPLRAADDLLFYPNLALTTNIGFAIIEYMKPGSI